MKVRRVPEAESSTYDETQGVCVTRAMLSEIDKQAHCPLCMNIAHRKSFEAETGLKTRPPLFAVCPAHGREPETDTPTEVRS